MRVACISPGCADSSSMRHHSTTPPALPDAEALMEVVALIEELTAQGAIAPKVSADLRSQACSAMSTDELQAVRNQLPVTAA